MKSRKPMSKASIVGLSVLILAIFFGMFYGYTKLTGTFGEGDNGDGSGAVDEGELNCPDDGDTSLKIDFKNTANETGSEGIDITGYLYKVVGNSEEYVTSISDTTSPTASTIDCGYKYVFKTISASGASGDSSWIKSKISGDSDVKIVNGHLEFIADSSNENIILGSDSHATLKCRLYDNNQNGFVWDSVGASNTDYETDGVTFTSTTNGTAMDETLGLNLEYDCKAVQVDTNYNDRGVLVLIEAPTSTWAEPTVKANGKTLADIKSSGLNDDEVKAYANYEYVFLIPQSEDIYDAGEGLTLEVFMDLAEGVSSASLDPEVDLVPRGSVLSIDGVNVLVGTGVQDDASKTTIHTVYDSTIDVT